jgi:PIN domain nuclease of toxin-antitoxin system
MLWAIESPQKLGSNTRIALEAADSIYVSAASVWEARIKSNLGRLKLPDGLLALTSRSGFTELPINWEQADAIGRLKLSHKDPFDHLVLTQAWQEQLTLVTADAVLLKAQPELCLDARL